MDARRLERAWREERRWHGIERTYSAEDVLRLRGSTEEAQFQEEAAA